MAKGLTGGSASKLAKVVKIYGSESIVKIVILPCLGTRTG